MKKFWKRRHRVTRVVMFTVLLPVALGYGLAAAAIEAMREEKATWKEIKDMYRELWTEPRDN